MMGGPGAWDHVDQTDGEFWFGFSDQSIPTTGRGEGLMMISIAQCKDEKCEGQRAFFYQLQTRSADEPMTTFFRVSLQEKVRGFEGLGLFAY